MDPLDDIEFKRADPGDGAARRLIMAALAYSGMATTDPSNHTLDVAGLRQPDIRFWIVADNTGVVGCGALKTLSEQAAELKSVFVVKSARGRGLGRAIISHLIGIAGNEGTREMLLETGSSGEYRAARGLYAALGFSRCDPIPGYGPDPNSIFMRLPLDPAAQTPQVGLMRSRSSTG